MKGYVFGQMGVHTYKINGEDYSDRSSAVRFTGGGGAERRIPVGSESKSVGLSMDLGFSIDHAGYVGIFPAVSIGLHYFF